MQIRVDTDRGLLSSAGIAVGAADTFRGDGCPGLPVLAPPEPCSVAPPWRGGQRQSDTADIKAERRQMGPQLL